MSTAIYKYQLSPMMVNHIKLPAMSRILSAGEQNGGLVIWVQQQFPPNEKYTYEIAVIGTGISTDMVEEGDSVFWQFIQTVQMSDGLVWHVYVKVKFDELDKMTDGAS